MTSRDFKGKLNSSPLVTFLQCSKPPSRMTLQTSTPPPSQPQTSYCLPPELSSKEFLTLQRFVTMLKKKQYRSLRCVVCRNRKSGNHVKLTKIVLQNVSIRLPTVMKSNCPLRAVQTSNYPKCDVTVGFPFLLRHTISQ